jgi:hypothetical protein
MKDKRKITISKNQFSEIHGMSLALGPEQKSYGCTA